MKKFVVTEIRRMNGGPVEEIKMSFDDKREAQSYLVCNLHMDLQYGGFNNMSEIGETLPIDELQNMFYDDPEFKFDVDYLALWNGEELEESDHFCVYEITERMSNN
jgi:hypothetical protein